MADARVVDDRARAAHSRCRKLPSSVLAESIGLRGDPPQEHASAVITHAYTSRKTAPDGAGEWYNN